MNKKVWLPQNGIIPASPVSLTIFSREVVLTFGSMDDPKLRTLLLKKYFHLAVLFF